MSRNAILGFVVILLFSAYDLLGDRLIDGVAARCTIAMATLQSHVTEELCAVA
jgi:hypothetical protein